ncbi:hypothetical protein D9Q98_006839 [Chlorella vulgaris]|uniref:Uncharacterized protein n=1 Tax=Chlorella vulgaris TaxID=3077 RepID=A0A9D4TIX8_CHLVU|nr:hypothetical protein D9Q98_006839 [Chlorella vulgaris]
MDIELRSLQGDHEKLETAIERYQEATERLEEMEAAHANYESKRTTLRADAAQIDALYQKNCAAKQIPAA